MHVRDALERRMTIRAFRPDPVPRQTILDIMADAAKTPSWADTQPWEVYVAGGEATERLRAAFVRAFDEGVAGDPEIPAPAAWPDDLQARMNLMIAGRAALAPVPVDPAEGRKAFGLMNRRFFEAPAVVYLCMERSLSPWSVFDMGAMAQSIMLAAQDHGVDSAPAVNLVIYPDLIRAELGIPEELLLLFGVALGYRDAEHEVNQYRSPRRAVDDFVRLAGF
jgi:nitroreductase